MRDAGDLRLNLRRGITIGLHNFLPDVLCLRRAGVQFIKSQLFEFRILVNVKVLDFAGNSEDLRMFLHLVLAKPDSTLNFGGPVGSFRMS